MLKISSAIGVLLVLYCAISVPAIETVRVDARFGAPCIVVDGKPVRARIFFGAPGTRPLSIGPVGRLVSFDFSPSEDGPAKATMHFRFGNKPGDIYLDDIRVVDLAGGADTLATDDFESGQQSFDRSWNVWPPAKQNTVGTVKVEPRVGRDGSGGLHIAIKSPPDGNWPDFHIHHNTNLSLLKGHRYRVSFWAKANPSRDLTVAFYRPGDPYVYLGGPPGVFEQQIKLAADAGVNFVSFMTRLPWPKPGEAADWSSVDTVCQTVLDANPKAMMIARIDVNAPPWWMAAHPDDAMVWDSGDHPQKAAVASPDFRREAAEHLAALVEHLETKFGLHMAGYHPAGQNTDEWFYQDSWLPGLNGYSKCEQRAWRQWLSDRYHDDAGLRKAWNDSVVTLESAAVPSPAARHQGSAGVFRDPVAERALIDFGEFQQQMMADCVCTLAKAVRQASHGRKLVLFFYGYVFELAAIANGPATSGHYALRQVLSSPDIDILCSPISYFDRGLGQSAPAMTAAESIALAGKMYLEEDDTYTYLATGDPPGSADHVDSLDKTNQELLRNTAQCGLRNFATWWMDLGATGWFNDAGMWQQMTRLSALDQPMLDTPRPFHPEIAAVVDSRSMMRVSPGPQQEVTIQAVSQARAALGRMGAPYGQYLLDDVLAGKVHAKVYVFLSAWCLDPEQRRQLLAATRGSLRIWCYAPGYQEERSTTLDGMHELTSFNLRNCAGTEAWATPTAAGVKLGLTEPFGLKQKPKPLFAVTDASPDEILATYPDGSAAIALRRSADGASLFVGPPGLTSRLLRLAARQAGAHLYTQSDCNICANGPFILVHASNPGPVEIDAGRAEQVRDLLTGQPLGNGPKIMLPIDRGATRLLAIDQK